MLEISFQFPYAMMVGWESFVDKEVTRLPFKSLVLHLLIVTIEFKWDLDE